MGALGVERTVRHRPLSKECGVACRVEWLGGRAKLHLTFLSAEGFESTERQITELGVVIVALPERVAIGAPIKVSMARAHGRAPLEVSGCVVYGMPQGAAVKLDFSSHLVKAKWEALKRTRTATHSANQKAHRRRASKGDIPSGVFHISHAGIDVYYKRGGEGCAAMTMRLEGPKTLGRLHKALQDGEMLLAPSCVDAGIGEFIEVRLMASSLNEVCFRSRVVCRVPKGTIMEPVGLTPQTMVALGELGRSMVAGSRSAAGIDSGVIPVIARTTDSGPMVPLARTQPMAPLSRPTSSPELVVPHTLLQENKPAPSQPFGIKNGRSQPKPLRKITPGERKPKEHPQALRLREQAEAMAALNPWELLGLHWSAYDQLIDENHEAQKKRYLASNYPPAIYKEAKGALEEIHAHLDKAREDLDTHLKRLVARKQIVDEKQIKGAIGHYLERAKMATWRGEREAAYDAYRRVYEIDPLNPEARKRFKKKGA